jgi:hypothetical protein
MSTKPATVPQWDTNQTNIATPAAGKLTDGWEDDEQPPASWFNWFFYWVWKWVEYLRDQVFTGGLQVTGAASGTGVYGIGGTGNAFGVRGDGSGSGSGVRGIGGATGIGGEFTGGASGGAGVRGVGAAANAIGGSFSGAATGGAATGVQGVGGAAGGYGGVFLGSGSLAGVSALKGSGDSAIEADGYVNLGASANPASTDAITDKLTPMNIVKAWGRITTGGSAAVLAGFNVASILATGGGIQVTLASPMSNTDYAVVANLTGGSGVAARTAVTVASTTVFTIFAYDYAGVSYDIAANNIGAAFIVMGQQP